MSEEGNTNTGGFWETIGDFFKLLVKFFFGDETNKKSAENPRERNTGCWVIALGVVALLIIAVACAFGYSFLEALSDIIMNADDADANTGVIIAEPEPTKAPNPFTQVDVGHAFRPWLCQDDSPPYSNVTVKEGEDEEGVRQVWFFNAELWAEGQDWIEEDLGDEYCLAKIDATNTKGETITLCPTSLGDSHRCEYTKLILYAKRKE